MHGGVESRNLEESIPMKKTLVTMCVVTALLCSCSGDNTTGPTVRGPTVTTASVTNLTQSTAECGGNVTSDGGATVTSRGVCWSTNANPTVADSKTTDGSGTGGFTSSITGLAAATPYFVRAYAINSAGTGYGQIRSFETESPDTDSTGTVTDVDGNVYKTVRIGNQWWMAENLRVTHYRDGSKRHTMLPGSGTWTAENSGAPHDLIGDEIPNVTDDGAWSALSTGAYCNYDNDENNAIVYGRLYNWYAVADSREIAPVGWHVPSDGEWQTLVDFLGGGLVAGGGLKETGTAHWLSPNTGATDQVGFTALPGGYRLILGPFGHIGMNALFWSSTEDNGSFAWYRSLFNSSPGINHMSDSEKIGMSVRCVRD
jgi:uncharacterized protein (TIGR02145 family)